MTDIPGVTPAEREAGAREVYRRLHPGSVNTPDSMRTRESDAVEADRAYTTWDAGRAGPALIYEAFMVIDALIADGWRPERPVDSEVAGWDA